METNQAIVIPKTYQPVQKAEMIPKEKFPTDRNFTVDEIEETGLDRKEVILTLQRMDQDGDGKFVIGRRGGKSRFIWKGKEGVDNTLSLVAELPAPKPFSLKLREEPISYPAPVIKEKEEEEVIAPSLKNGKARDPFIVIRDLREGVSPEIPSADLLKEIAMITGFKGASPISFDALKVFLDKQHKELLKLREGAIWDEPPGIEHVPAELITEIPLDNGFIQTGWMFWNPEQRAAIAKELRTYRKLK